MKGNHRLNLALATCIWLVSAAPFRTTLEADSHAAELRFARPWSSAAVVPVTVNGAGLYSFLIDTGSSHTAVSPVLAASLGAPRVAKTMVSTAAGDQWAAVVRLDRLVVGPLEQTNVLATELALDVLDAGAAVDGVLGRDILGQKPFALDYRRGVITWNDPRAEPDGVVLPLDSSGPLWLVRLDTGNGTRRLVPDSGATGMVMFDRGQWPALQRLPGTIGVETVTNETVGRPAVLGRLNFGPTRFVDQEVTVMDGSRVSVEHGDGLLPLHWFDRVVFDTAAGRVVFVHSPASNLQASGLRVSGSPPE
ncbi:MAG: aspartyl protease family protein [Vicinamibacterales bacterium]